VVGTLAHLLARGLAYRVGAVGDCRLECEAAAAGTAFNGVGAAAAVGMAARGPDRLASDEKAGAHEMALLDGGLNAPVASARVAHGRKAAIEHGAQPRRRPSGEQGERHRLHETDVHLAVDDVHMAIDEPRHQRAPAAVDHGRVPALDHGRTQLAHAIILDEQLMAADELATGGLEELEVAE